MHYQRIGLSPSLCLSTAYLLFSWKPSWSGPVLFLGLRRPRVLLVTCSTSDCLLLASHRQAHSLSWTLPREVVISMVRYVSFSLLLWGSVLGVYLGSGGSRSPCSRVPPFSKHLERGYLGWFPLTGLPRIPPLRLMVSAPR